MRLPAIVSFVGFIILMAGTWCPLLRPFHLFNMDVYQLSQPYGMVLLLTAVIGIVGVGLNKIQLVRIASWLSLMLVTLLLLAAFLKVHSSFSFIPFRSISGFLAGQIKFKWGWFVLFAGPFIALIGAMFKPSKYSNIDLKVNDHNNSL